MTRSRLTRTLRYLYVFLAVVLGISLFAKFADHLGLPKGGLAEGLLKDLYEFIRDMSLLLATGGVAYVTNVFQKRNSFIDSLKTEWRDIVATKSTVFAYTQIERPTEEQYMWAFCKLSETIDNMRIVYRNVGETDGQIGLYPYAPLHDMRRALQTLEPRKNGGVTVDDRRLARDAILQSFYALRESFLDELEPEAPDNPVIIFGGRRLKKPGTPDWATAALERQRADHDRLMPADPRIHAFLMQLYEKEHTTAKPWRQVANGNGRNREPEPPARAGPQS